MSTDIEGIKNWLAENAKRPLPWKDYEDVFSVGEGKMLLAELEKAEAERDAEHARAEKWKTVAEGSLVEYGQANKRAAEAESQIEAAHIALDLTDASDRHLNLVERIETHQRQLQGLIDAIKIILLLLDSPVDMDPDTARRELQAIRIEARNILFFALHPIPPGATAEETLKHLPTIRDSIIHDAMAKVEHERDVLQAPT